jgi:hypothetical protein
MERSLASGEKPRPRRRIVQSNWTRAALLLAAVETILLLVHVIPRWLVVVIAALVLAGYFFRGRNVSSPSLRQTAWTIALSQAVVLFVPLILWIIGAVVVVAIAAVAAALLVLLILDR